ncbi:sterol desaturase family protein [Chryseolinea sp. T2]|uniref:sterol desaturase family protein n=1 Tax=Chryseolinea sp. T2 TaxID=3129255 RepID=UPI003076D88E
MGHIWDKLNYSAFAIPAFFVFVGLEYFAAVKRRKAVFQYESSVVNISVGVAERLLNLFLTAAFLGLFRWVYQEFAIWRVPDTWYVWVFLLLATDLVWYWYHRFGHEVNLFWAAHVVHHQSEEFNYTVSARITTVQAIVRNLFWCILPLAGFKPEMVTVTLIIHGTYSFFTHTQMVTRLGWLELVLITPSHHRVHHASNERYLNKNYGDLFVFWDKMFGTFQAEDEEPRYGLTHPLKSFSFIWQHVHYFAELFYAVRMSRGISDGLRILFGSPELMDQRIRPMLERKFVPPFEAAPVPLRVARYVNAQLFLAICVLFFFTLFFDFYSLVDRTIIVLLILITLVNCGALLQQRRWIYYIEFSRLILLAASLSAFVGNVPFQASLLMLIAVSAEAFEWRKQYLRLLYERTE